MGDLMSDPVLHLNCIPFKWIKRNGRTDGVFSLEHRGTWCTIKWAHHNVAGIREDYSCEVTTESLLRGDLEHASFQCIIEPEIFCAASAQFIHKYYNHNIINETQKLSTKYMGQL